MKKYKVTGMSCAACSSKVEREASRIQGVESCSVNLLLGTLSVEGNVNEEELFSAVRGAGYGIYSENEKEKAKDSEDFEEKKERSGLVIRLIASIVFLIPLMYISMVHMMLGAPLPAFLFENPMANGILQMLLCIVVLIINGKFFVNGLRGIFHLAPNMDTLVAMGSFASFVFSLFEIFKMSSAIMTGDIQGATGNLSGLYFDSSAMILVLITVGNLLSAHAKGKTTEAIRALLDLAPKNATVERDGVEIIVPVSELKVGDVFVVRRGENLPCDGEIIEGAGAFDESCLTGESIPKDKSVNDKVWGVTTLSSGFVKVRATDVGEKTAISRIVELVKEAAGSKAPVAKVADKVAGVFVPFVIICSIICAAVWLIVGETVGFAVARAVSVLVISCPCALGLATPLSVMVGTGVGAKNGILYKTAESIEISGRIKTVVFDKTGTLTEGKPTVTDILPMGITEDRLIKLAASVELMSEHPLARAIVEKYKDSLDSFELYPVSDFEAKQGGVSGLIDGERIFIGNQAYIATETEAVLSEFEQKTALELASLGKTLLIVSGETKILGFVALTDRCKSDAKDAVEDLHLMGIKTLMLTGDNRKCAEAVAKEIGIDEVISDVFPNDKAMAIKNISGRGKICMVGDGVNDAPALTSADLGIAIGSGTDIAIDSAGVVLSGGDVYGVCKAIRLGRRTLYNIYSNLFWAFCYNIIGIPLAAGVFIPLFGWELSPMFGAMSMSVSSLLVVLNSLTLNFIRFKNTSKIKTEKTKETKEKKDMEQKIYLKVEGMMCHHCSGRVQKTLEETEGVILAEASHERGDAYVETNGKITEEELIKIINDLGYKASK